MRVGLDELKQLFETLDEAGIAEFEYQDEDYQVRVAFRDGMSNGSAQLVNAAALGGAHAPTAPPPVVDDANTVYVTSPFVGTFYRSPAPGAEPFVNVGSHVSTGETLCIVEAMKLMNEIECETAGSVVEILVENEQSVEFGQKLFKLTRG
jgi:acetyl-CoA carboxylase biotin carboxyl carrier protein